jgi:peptide/nickel transport system permease protein
LSGAVLLTLVAMALFAPWIARYDPNALQYGFPLQQPNADFWLGTDHIGRDIFSRIVWGARSSLIVGFGAVLFGVTTGSLAGLLSAWFGGFVDMILQRFVDALMAIPALMIAMVVATVLDPNQWTLAFAIGLNFIPGSARICRSVVLSLREAQFVLAVRSSGATEWRIMLRHVMPNLASPVAVVASGALAAAILVESALSFLGLGLRPPNPSWGSMVSQEGQQYFQEAPWILFAASGAVSLAVLSATMFGDAMRDMLDPRVRSRK